MSGSGLIPRAVDLCEIDYPWQGQPRGFTAMAMPQGDPAYGVEGQLVLVIESRGGGVPKQKFYSRGEAERLYDQLRQALGAYEAGEAITAGCDHDCRPRPALGPFPFNHRTLAEIAAEEERVAA